MDYTVHRGTSGLAEIEQEWRSVEERSECHLFQTFASAELWQRVVGEPSGAMPLVVVAREGGRAIGIFPACRLVSRGVPMLAWLGGPGMLDYGDVLFDRAAGASADGFVGESLTLLAECARGSFVYLTNVRDDASAIEPLRTRLRVYRRGAAPYLSVDGDYDAYVASLRPKRIQELRRKERRLAELGNLEFRVLAQGDPAIVPAMERLVELQRLRFPSGLTRTDLFDERHVRFRLEQATRDAGSRVSVLSLDGEVIAVSLNIVFRGKLCCLLPAQDMRYARYSLGGLMTCHLLRECFENHWNACDFGWGEEPYKYEWTSTDVGLTTFVSRGPAGAAAANGAVIARALGRTAAKLTRGTGKNNRR